MITFIVTVEVEVDAKDNEEAASSVETTVKKVFGSRAEVVQTEET